MARFTSRLICFLSSNKTFSWNIFFVITINGVQEYKGEKNMSDFSLKIAGAGILAAALVCGFNVPGFAETGKVVIRDTRDNSVSYGRLSFKDTPQGLEVKGELTGVTPGKHGIHIHQFGVCGDEGKEAGSHYNPDNVPHGFLPQDGFSGAHAGDLGNIDIAANGTGRLDVTIPGLTLASGKYSVGGRSVVIHEKEDDFGQPLGNAGGRTGCGVIKIVSG
jgi:Cu-Zn family superoxide dismutase